eukprot:s8961_g2.t1
MEYSREAFNPKTYYDRDQETNVMHYSWLHILSKITPKLTGYAAFSLIRPPPNGPTEYLYIDPVGIVLTQSIKDTSADTMALLIDHNIQVPAKFTDRVTRRKVDKEKNPQAHAVSVTVTNSVAFESNEEFYFDLIDAKSNATLAAAMLVILSNEECAAESYANLVALAVYAIVALQGLEFRSKPPPSPGQDPGVVRFQEEEVTTVEEFQAGRCTNTT